LPTDTETPEGVEIGLDQMDLNFITNRPDGSLINLKSFISCIHGLTTHVQLTPQQQRHFLTFLGAVEVPQQSPDILSSQPDNTPEEEDKEKMLIPVGIVFLVVALKRGDCQVSLSY
jgi:hypothetical protein